MSAPADPAVPGRPDARIVAVVPARQEAGRVGDCVRALLAFCDEVLVVDDASTDATADEARGAGARVVTLPVRRGKGGALAAGVAAAPPGAEVLLLADADLAGDAAVLRALLEPLETGRADVAIAAPPPSGPSGFGLVESLARAGVKALTGLSLARPLSGQRAIRADLAMRIGFASGFGVETAMTIDAHRAGARVVEVPCAFGHAATGRDLAGFTHRARQGRDVLAALVRRSLRRGSRRGIVRP